MALFELFLDSPHSLEYFLDHLPVSWSSLVSEDGIKIIFKVCALIKIGCCSGWFADEIGECPVVVLRKLIASNVVISSGRSADNLGPLILW
jgi:hypothetical protein